MMEQLIFAIFNSIADEAMERGMSVTLRNEIDRGESKTILSSNKRDENTLTLSIYPLSKEEEPTEDGEGRSEDEGYEEEEEK